MKEDNSLEQVKLVVDQLPYGIGIFEKGNTDACYYNKAYFSISKFTPSQLQIMVQSALEKIIYKDDYEMARKKFHQMIYGEDLTSFDYRCLNKDEEVFWIRVQGSMFQVDGMDYVMLSYLDISKEMSVTMKFGLLAENVGSSVSIYRLVDGEGVMVFANDNFYKLLGTSRDYYSAHTEEINGQCCALDVAEATHNLLRKAMKTGKPQRMENQITRLDGRKLWIRRQITVRWEETEANYYFISVVDDITGEKKRIQEREQMLERQGLVIDEMKAAIFEYNSQTDSFYISDSFKKYTLSQSTPRDILNNRASLDAVHPDDLPILMQFFKDVKPDSEKVEAKLRLKLLTGGYRWVKLIVIFHRDKKGEPVRTLGMLVDINEDQETNSKMNRLVNTIPGGVAIYHIGKEMITSYLSDGLYRLCGRTAEDYFSWQKDDSFETVLYEDDRERVMRAVFKAAARKQDINLLFRIKHVDGEPVWVQMSASMIREEQGTKVYYAVFLKPSEETDLYRQVVDMSANAIFVGDRKKRTILYTNKSWRKLVGIPEDQAITGQKLYDLIPPEKCPFDKMHFSQLRTDAFTEFYYDHDSGAFLHIFTKALEWNGVSAYLIYALDETVEHRQRRELQQIVDYVPGGIGIYQISQDSVQNVYLNEGFYRLLGMNGAMMDKGHLKSLFDYVHPEDLVNLTQKFRLVSHGETMIDTTFRCQNQTWGYVWVRLIGRVVKKDQDHQLLYCSFINVQAQKEAELQYLKEVDDFGHFDSEALFMKARYNISRNKLEYIHCKDTMFGIISKNIGYEDALEEIVAKIVDEDERQRIFQTFQRTQLLKSCENGTSYYETECPVRGLDGTVHWCEIHYKSYLEPHTGDVICFVYGFDVTQKKNNQLIMDQIFAGQYELQGLLNLESRIMEIQDLHSGICHSFDTTNLNLKERYQSFIQETVAREDQHIFFMDIDKLLVKLEKKDSITFAYTAIEKKGRNRRKQVWISFLDKFHETIWIVQSDVTQVYIREQQQIAQLKDAMEVAQKADQAKTSFLSRVSHDMRTPLNDILGLTSLMREKQSWKDIQSDLDQMELSGKYLLNLINDTLDVNKIENGNLELHPVVCNVNAVFHNTVDLIKPNLQQKRIHLQLHLEPFPFEMVLLDIGRVEQIFVNILGNAVKFTPEEGTFEISGQNKARSNEPDSKPDKMHYEFHIKDNGIGMSQEFLPHIFEPFTQEHGETTSQYTGTGLGMTICRQVVELMGGRISVKSQKGRGTEFVFSLEISRATKEQVDAADTKKSHHWDLKELGGRRILLCEDQPLNAEIAKRLLERQGMVVDCAQNGEIGLSQFTSKPEGYYDAILMDIRMPGMDGLATTRAIRGLSRKDSDTVPIIAMSANAFEEDVRESLDAGMNAHIAKPVDPQMMYHVLLDQIMEAGK